MLNARELVRAVKDSKVIENKDDQEKNSNKLFLRMKQIRLFDIPGIDRYFVGCYIHSIDHGDFKSLKTKLK